MIEDDEIEYDVADDVEDTVASAVLEIKGPRKKRQPKEPKEYVNKDEMWNEIYSYYQGLGKNYSWEKQKISAKDEFFPNISPRLTQMIDDIAIKMGYRPNFIRYSYLDEMRGDARTKMFKALRDCSFKCFTHTKIIKEEIYSDSHAIYFLDKRGKLQNKQKESTDKFETKPDGKWITFRANAFGYYSRIASHAFLNRIKKEKLMNETKEAFQHEVWEKMMATETFQSVRRPRMMTDFDENDAMFDGE